MDRLVFSLAVIGSGLFSGYFLRVLVESRKGTPPVAFDRLRILLQKFGLLFFCPVTFFGAVWVMPFSEARLAALPAVGASVLLLGGGLGLLAARVLGHGRREAAVLYVCGCYSNCGSVGVLACYMFFGEAGYALAFLYKLLEEIVYYPVGLTVVRTLTAEAGSRERRSGLSRILRDPFILAALTAVLGGGALNVLGVPRPEGFVPLNAVFIPLGTFVLLVSIGMAMRVRKAGHYLREGLAACAIKFLACPLTAAGLAVLFGLGAVEGGLPVRVALVMGSMPVAFAALVPPSLYDLDIDMANACWLVTNLSLFLTLPVVYFITRAI